MDEKKILYFEGAGWVSCGDVGNCRIRTAFHLKDGKAVYLEITGREVNKHDRKRDMYNEYTYIGFIDFCYYIMNDDDCNKHSIPNTVNLKFEYSKENILKFINSLGCSFDEVNVLPNLAGYRVHGSYSNGIETYHYGDEFSPNFENIARAEQIYKLFYDVEKRQGKKYPNFSLWVDEFDKGILHLVRHFNNKNKHWIMRCDIDNWQKTIKLSHLGKYGC